VSLTHANPHAFRPPDDGPGGIIAVGPDRREDAIARLLAGERRGDPAHTQRFLDYARQHSVTLDYLWGRLDRRGRFDSVVLAVPNPGRSAMMFASPARNQIESARNGQVLDFACRQLQEAGLHLAQALLEPHDAAGHDSFVAGGFHQLASLGYLERSLRSRHLPPPPQWPAGVTTLPYDESLRGEMIATLDESYQQTMDCPGLRGYRETADILDGHRAAGLFEPRLWTLLRIDGRAGGVLLLNPSSDLVSIELVYLGLAPWARGRGLGSHLLRHALHSTAARPERLMTLAVDETNTPALRLYQREHFRPVLRRVAMIRGLRTSR